MMITKVEIAGRRWYQDEGKTLKPSASSVLDILFPMNKDFIPEEALVMGTLCHNEISKAMLSIVNGGHYQVHPDPKVANRIETAILWVVNSGLNIAAIESPVIYLGIGMTPDWVGTAGGKPHIVDWKFAETMSERYYYQMEIYMRAEGATTATVVRINREGIAYPMRIVKDDERWELVKSAINVRHHLDKKEKRYLYTV